MSIVFSRVEERLIHGQVAYSWNSALQFDAFVVIDDASAKDEFMRSLLEMACPRGKKVFIYDEQTAIENINTIKKRLFLIAKSPLTFLHLYEAGIHFEHLNIGSIHIKPNKKEIYQTVCVSDEEIEALHALMNAGITCEIQKLPSDSKKNVKDLLK